MIGILIIILTISMIQYVLLGLSIALEDSPIIDKKSFWLWLIPLGLLVTLGLYFIKTYKKFDKE